MFASGNIEGRGEQNSLFPLGPFIKCLVTFCHLSFERWEVEPCGKSERELGISHTQVLSVLIFCGQDGGFSWGSFGLYKCICGLVRGRNLACYFYN